MTLSFDLFELLQGWELGDFLLRALRKFAQRSPKLVGMSPRNPRELNVAKNFDEAVLGLRPFGDGLLAWLAVVDPEAVHFRDRHVCLVPLGPERRVVGFRGRDGVVEVVPTADCDCTAEASAATIVQGGGPVGSYYRWLCPGTQATNHP